ncbi:hypothetical protein ACFLU8_03625 [Chloroflexota bacterium]
MALESGKAKYQIDQLIFNQHHLKTEETRQIKEAVGEYSWNNEESSKGVQ